MRFENFRPRMVEKQTAKGKLCGAERDDGTDGSYHSMLGYIGRKQRAQGVYNYQYTALATAGSRI